MYLAYYYKTNRKNCSRQLKFSKNINRHPEQARVIRAPLSIFRLWFSPCLNPSGSMPVRQNLTGVPEANKNPQGSGNLL